MNGLRFLCNGVFYVVKVTIGLPFYNDEKTLKNAINSVLLQTYQDWELILIDDGSRDESLNIAKSIDDDRIIIVSDGINKGLAVRLNEIAQKAKGKYLARMDADDLMHPERIEKQIIFLEENSEVDVVGSNAYSIDVNGDLLGIRHKRTVPLNIYMVLKKGVFIHPSIMGKRTWFCDNPYDESLMSYRAEDYELWCRTAGSSSFFIMEQPLLFYREANSIARNINNYMCTFSSMMKIIKKYSSTQIKSRHVFFLYLQVYLRLIVYYLLAKLGQDKILIKKRYKKIRPEDLQNVKKILLQIKG
jgi:glycosyltransferase involved in cell wall biosynthesis